MIEKYNRLEGVPRGWFYLCRVLCFGDFECPYEDKIILIAKNREELEEHCRKNNYNLDGSWAEYTIGEN